MVDEVSDPRSLSAPLAEQDQSEQTGSGKSSFARLHLRGHRRKCPRRAAPRLLKAEFGIGAGLGSAPRSHRRGRSSSRRERRSGRAPPPRGGPDAELEAGAHQSQAHEAEVARVTAAAIAHVAKLEAWLGPCGRPAPPPTDELEAELPAALAARGELSTDRSTRCDRIGELRAESPLCGGCRSRPRHRARRRAAHLLPRSHVGGLRADGVAWPGARIKNIARRRRRHALSFLPGRGLAPPRKRPPLCFPRARLICDRG